MLITSRTALCDYLAQGGRLRYLLFWGHQASRDGSITKQCFSQWFEAPFLIDDICYPTAEHYMMAEKARLFADQDALQRILSATSPGAAKAAGRKIRGFDEAIWQEQRSAIVVRGNLAKFAQNPALRDFLLQSADRVLVEASPVDAIWGIGLAADDENAENPAAWRGENLLGFALMQVREQLRCAIG